MNPPAAVSQVAAAPPETVIRPSRGWVSLNLGEIWAYRELLCFLVWRDLKVRYKQTILGAAWAILQPVLTMLVFTVVFVVLLGMMLYYGIVPGAACLVLPLFVALAAATALAAGTWLSALNVRYRDVRYTIPFLTQIWFFVTPVAYPSELVPEPWRVWLGLNPMAGVVEGFRWALLGRPPGTGPLRSISAVVVLLFLAGGLIYFRRSERR